MGSCIPIENRGAVEKTLVDQPATYQEIISQDKAWQQAILIVEQSRLKFLDFHPGQYDQIILIGCGSTYYLALAAASVFQELTHNLARGFPSSELLFYPNTVFLDNSRSLLVAFSRSGESTETVIAVNQYSNNKRGEVVTITNFNKEPFSKMGKINLTIPAGQEISIAQTRAFSSMYVCAVGIASLLSGREDLLAGMHRLPEEGRKLIERNQSIAQSIGGDLTYDRYYFLGSGPRYGIACEASLKMKEMSLTHSEPFHFFEFRHGPISMVNSQTLVIGLISEKNRKMEETVLNDIREKGAKVITSGDKDCDICFNSDLPETIINVLHLPLLQLTAYHRACAKQLNPDRPNNLKPVVRLNWLDQLLNSTT